jgi:hypothetical protein
VVICPFGGDEFFLLESVDSELHCLPVRRKRFRRNFHNMVDVVLSQGIWSGDARCIQWTIFTGARRERTADVWQYIEAK